jgi:biotin carboxyl carrier protein
MELVARIGETDRQVTVEQQDDGKWRVVVNGTERVLDARRIDATQWIIDTGDGRAIKLDIEPNKDGDPVVDLRGVTQAVKLLDPRRVRLEAAQAVASKGRGPAGPEILRTPMPGKVVKVLVKVGEDVAAGQGVAVIEAMKMENEMRAGRAGKIAAIHVTEGQTLEGQAQVLTIE